MSMDGLEGWDSISPDSTFVEIDGELRCDSHQLPMVTAREWIVYDFPSNEEFHVRRFLPNARMFTFNRDLGTPDKHPFLVVQACPVCRSKAIYHYLGSAPPLEDEPLDGASAR